MRRWINEKIRGDPPGRPTSVSPARSSTRETFPSGLKLLYEGEDPVADIVFVHGLTGDRDRTWTATGAEAPWSQTLLPLKVPNARILTFGYDAYITDWRSMVSQNRIGNHAMNLLTALATYRENDDTDDRSIIFVAHSMGGLVCEDALVASQQRPEKHLRKIFLCVYGIIFLGTPHHGSGLAMWAEMLAKSIGLLKQTNTQILQVLQTDSEVLARIQDSFHAMVRARSRDDMGPIEITCFYEELPLPGIGPVVPLHSAIIPGYTPIGIHRNHMDMTKFESEDDPGFIAVTGEIHRWIKQLKKEDTVGGTERKYQHASTLPKANDQTRNSTPFMPSTTELDAGYTQILEHSMKGVEVSQREQFAAELRQVIGSIVVLSEPLSPTALGHLLGLDLEVIYQKLRHLRLILSVSDDSSTPIRLLHPSFRDFLFDKERCNEPLFWINEKDIHRQLVKLCLERLSLGLKRDICDLKQPGISRTDIDTSILQQYLSIELQYACQYWVHHLHQSEGLLGDNGEVHIFLEKYLLQWFECLSLIGKSSQMISMITLLESMLDVDKSPQLCAFIYDAKRFVLYNGTIIETAPLQIYYSALLFAPQDSLVRRKFQNMLPLDIKRFPEPKQWGSLLQTIEGHTDWIHAVVFSGDGKLIASVSQDDTVRIWDAVTGRALHTLRSQDNRFSMGVAFSPDDKILTSVSFKCKVQLWNVATTMPLRTLQGHYDLDELVVKVAFSPNGKILALGLYDGTICLMNLNTGAVLYVPEDNSEDSPTNNPGRVLSLAFSPDSQILAIGLSHEPVHLCNTATGVIVQTLEEDSEDACGIAFSPNGKMLALGSGTVQFWDVTTALKLKTLRGHRDWVTAVTFSPNGKVLASGSADNTIRLWDVASNALLQIFKGHKGTVTDLTFSPEGSILVSGSGDATVRLWDTETVVALQEFNANQYRSQEESNDKNSAKNSAESYDESSAESDDEDCDDSDESSDGFQAICFSPDHTMVALWLKSTIQILDTETGAELWAVNTYSKNIHTIIFSPNGQVMASAFDHENILLWDTMRGSLIQELNAESNIGSIGFSPDGKFVTCNRMEKVQIWDAATGKQLKSFHIHMSGRPVFSPDCKILALHDMPADSGEITLLDVETGRELKPLAGHKGRVRCLSFSPDNKMLVSGLWADRCKTSWENDNDNTAILWEIRTGVILKKFKGNNEAVTSTSAVAFSPNNRIVLLGSNDGIARLWDIKTGSILHVLRGHSETVNAAVFSPNGKLVASSSEDKTIRLWAVSTGEQVQIFEVNVIIEQLSFSREGPYLETERGKLTLSGFYVSEYSQSFNHHSIFVSDDWILQNNEKIVWIPEKERITGRLDSIGCSDRLCIMKAKFRGRTTIINFGNKMLDQRDQTISVES